MSLVVGSFLLGATQGSAERTLPKATVEFDEGFTRVSSIREIGDGRVLVLDRQDQILRLIDLDRGIETQVGRPGGGPGEYKSASRLIALGGDSTLLVDPGLQRSIVIGPGGEAGDVLLNSRELVSAPPGVRVPQAADAQGRLYFLGSGLGAGSGPGAAPRPPDSVALLRFDRRTGRVDTLARLKQALPNILIDRDGAKIKSVNIRKVRFRPHDDWAVAPDGRVVIVRTGIYRLDQRLAGGEVLHGLRIPYSPIAVTDAERAGAIDPLPKFKPPFEGPSTLVAGDGRTWVRRTTAFADSTSRYDVFDLTGHVVAGVSLLPRTRIAGFGKAVVYVVRQDQDDLEYLGRVSLPRP